MSDVEDLHGRKWSWVSHLGAILGFKLMCVLSGSTINEGTILRSKMSGELRGRLERVVRTIPLS